MFNNLINVLRDDEGATLVEYGLLVSLIAVVCIAALSLIGTRAKGMFNSVAGDV